MKYLLFPACFFLIIILVVCEAPEEDKNTGQKGSFVFAGQNDDSVVYFNISPDFSLITNKAGCNRQMVSDSVDLDLDRTYDFFITYNSKVPDLLGECCDSSLIHYDSTNPCQPTGWIYLTILVKNKDFELAVTPDSLLIAFGSGEMISDRCLWSNKHSFKMISYTYPETPGGLWNYLDDRYAGMRIIKRDTAYGWIRMSTQETLVIKDFALKRLY